MNNDFLEKYENDLIEKNTKFIAKNLKDVLPVEEIAKCTGLSISDVEKL